MGNGSANSPTVASPRARAATIARRVGSARALKVAESESARFMPEAHLTNSLNDRRGPGPSQMHWRRNLVMDAARRRATPDKARAALVLLTIFIPMRRNAAAISLTSSQMLL